MNFIKLKLFYIQIEYCYFCSEVIYSDPSPKLQKKYSFEIFKNCAQFPVDWDIIAARNIFLTKDYLQVLEDSAPTNMTCRFVGIFNSNKLVGVAVVQFLDLRNIESFGERDKKSKTTIRHWFFKAFTSRILIVGNNMLTGQNAFAFDENISTGDAINCLSDAADLIANSFRSDNKAPHLIIFKDFLPERHADFANAKFAKFFQFSTQPNMVLKFREDWINFDNYFASLSKKYRDHYKRARKKSDSVAKRKLSLAEIDQFGDDIHKLYTTVAQNAPFNTFYLSRGHFYSLKQNLKDKFLFYGYFENEKLIGFNTLIKNGNDIDTYFLGYDDEFQRQKMLYLNMLYDMIGFAINKGFKNLILGRTALEIKSSVGAKPIKMIGFMKHCNPIFNYFLPRLFKYFEPEISWINRNPFQD